MVSYVVVFFSQPHTSLTLSLYHSWHTLTKHTTQGLETAFERGEVSSWIDFFRRGALTPLYHDRFPKLSEELREALANGDEAAANLLSALNKVGCVLCAHKTQGKNKVFPRVSLFHLSSKPRRRLSRCVTHCRDFYTPRGSAKPMPETCSPLWFIVVVEGTRPPTVPSVVFTSPRNYFSLRSI